MSILQAIRIFLFYLLLGTSSLLWCTLSFFIAPFLPFRARYRFINVYWCRFALVLVRVFLNIRVNVTGAENIPAQPCVILSNHQSTWETFFLSAYFQPLSQVLKRELLFVPFFGWAMAMLRPIAIDRDNPKAALKHVAKKGDELLKDKVWVLIFPEGTRGAQLDTLARAAAEAFSDSAAWGGDQAPSTNRTIPNGFPSRNAAGSNSSGQFW